MPARSSTDAEIANGTYGITCIASPDHDLENPKPAPPHGGIWLPLAKLIASASKRHTFSEALALHQVFRVPRYHDPRLELTRNRQSAEPIIHHLKASYRLRRAMRPCEFKLEFRISMKRIGIIYWRNRCSGL